MLPLAAVACSLNARPTISPTRMSEFWQEPANLSQRNLLYGPGSAAQAPRANARYTLVEEEHKGFSPHYEVTDERGQEWSVKTGPEARTEVVVSRLLWAMGYHQPLIYYVPSWTLVAGGKARSEGPARFRITPKNQKKVGEWSWRDNPFLDTQPFAGLAVLMTIVNNWDLKSQQNAVYLVEREGASPVHRYVVEDLGASLGKTSWWLPGTRDDIEAFEHEPFIKGVSANRVAFHFKGAWREPQLIAAITPNDVTWMCERLARLTSSQWLEMFRAGGYTEAEASRFIRRLRDKIDEGLALGSGDPMKQLRVASAGSK
jgi:hypothetical protein